MASQLQDGNLLLILKQHVALLTGTVVVILEIFLVQFAVHPTQAIKFTLVTTSPW